MSKEPNKNRLVITTGRGAESNESGRFDKLQITSDLCDFGEAAEENFSLLRTEFFLDSSRSILAENNSPDIPFRFSMNFYRGCEHGCAYCYARPTHEYLGLSAGLDFESKIFVKTKAPDLLRDKLMSRSWEPEPINMSGVTDCYQPAERKFQLTRKCLLVLNEFKNPVTIITKNKLVTRDIDILTEMAQQDLAQVILSITTLDAKLGRELEPRTSTPQARLEAIELLAKARIPVGVNVAPVIPGLTDHELPKILEAARNAGAVSAAYTPLRLPYSVAQIFSEWLDVHRPDSKSKVLNAIKDLRDGKLNDAHFNSRMEGKGPRAESIRNLFEVFKKKFGFTGKDRPLRTDLFRRPGDQLKLF